MDINGFEIDEFNVHGLDANKKDQICPKCSPNRSPKNQKAKCASADWERGLLTCHHCSEITQLHTFKRKGGSEKTWVRPVWENKTELSDKVVKFFEERRISQSTLTAMRVTEGLEWMPQYRKEVPTIQFNYFINNELINVKYRGPAKSFKLVKDAEKIFYNLDSIVGLDTCVIVEGELDALALVESGVNNVVSVPNGATVGNNNLDYLDNCIAYFEGKTKIILATDNDEAGEALKGEFIRRFGSEVCYICEFGSFKDLNEVLIADGPDSVRRIVDGAAPVPLEGVNTINDIRSDIIDYMKNGGPDVYKPGIPGVDDLFSVIPGTTMVITATPGAGKTFFIDQYCIGMMKNHGWKTAFASPETKPDYIAGGNILRKMYKDHPDNIYPETEKFNEIMETMNDSFFYIDMDSFTLDGVLKKGQEMVRRKGIKILVIDPINIIRDVKKDSIQDYTISYFKKCNEFAKRNNCLVILSCHPVKVIKNERGDFPDLDYYSIAGGSDIANMAYYIIMMNRMYSVNQTKIKTLKVKYNFNGVAGEEMYFKYNMKTTDFEVAESHGEKELPW